MRIDRSALLAALESFARSGGGLVVGSPGAGKTYLVSELSKRLEQQEVPVLQVAVDALGEGSDAEIQQALDLDTDLISKVLGEDIRGGVLIIDGYDAARGEKTQRNILQLIGRAVRELTSWNVIVVVRAYDARKSPELGDLFPPPSEVRDGDSSIASRHFVIPPLAETEIGTLEQESPRLMQAYASASGDFKELLRVPFNLWLLERMLPETIGADFTGMRSQVQLLGLFWQRRVSAGLNGLRRENVLAGIARAMISNRSLSISKAQAFEPGSAQEWADLFSAEILVDRSFGNRVGFGHNILFDYAVSVLVLEEDAATVVEFLRVDLSRQLFLRPSLVFYFARLWHELPEQFWNNYRFLLSEGGIEGRLVGRLVPPSVVVQECAEGADLEPLLEMQDANEVIGPSAALYVLRSLRTWEPRSTQVWAEFLKALAGKLSAEIAWEVGLLTEIFLVKSTSHIIVLGHASRGLMDWIWAQRSARKELADALLGRFAVPLVAKTFWTNPTASRALLQPVLRLVEEVNFPIQALYQLAANVGTIAQDDPSFVRDVYRTIFSAEEVSESKTQMGGSTVLVMTSTRRQDFGMCHYLLLQYFPKFIEIAFREAASAAIFSANAYVSRTHSRGEEEMQHFRFRGGSATYISDGSVFWDSHFDPYEPILVIEQLYSRLDEILRQSGRTADVDHALDLLRDEAQVAFCWKRLLGLVAKHPALLRDVGLELCMAPAILLGRDTVYEAGMALGALAQEISPAEMQAIERTILTLESEPYRNRLISQIPTAVLVTPEGKTLRAALEETNQIVQNKPLVQFQTHTGEFTAEDWLKDKGIDLEKAPNKRVRELSAALSTAISSPNAAPSQSDLEAVQYAAAALWAALNDTADAEEAVTESAWCTLGRYARFMLTHVQDANEALGIQVRDVLLACGRHAAPKLYPNADSEFKSPVWGSSPRTEAAQLLPVWFARTGDQVALHLFLMLLEDPVPEVRFLSAHELWRLVKRAPSEFWSAIKNRTITEVNDVVLQGLLDSLGRVIPRYERDGVDVLSLLRDRARSGNAPRELADLYSGTVMWLVVVRQNPTAIGFLEEVLDEPVRYSKAIRRASFDAGARTAGKRDEPAEESAQGHNAAKWLVRLIDAVQVGIQQLAAQDGDRSEDSPFADLYRSIDTIVTRLWVARQGLQPAEAADFYIRVRPVLSRIVEFAMTPDLGALAPSTAHHAMEFLTDFVRVDPRGVLKMAWQITSRSPGYNLDSLAVDQVVKLVEVILADHRDQMRQPESLQHLLDLLDIFAETGWPQALRLVWRLDEVFR